MLDATKYINNNRTCSGTFILFNDDVTINVDTTTVPGVTTLLEIPDDHWSTTWKMYFNDASNNAAANNITINAGIGQDGIQQKINGQNSITINVNGGGVLIRILNNFSFIALLTNQGSATINGHIIQDEGITLPQEPIINFIGVGVTAFDLSGKTTVFIPGQAFISLTNAQMLTLISTNGVQPGQFYLITDGGNSNGGVVVQGMTVNSHTTYGAGLFLNADYQVVGNYSGVPGFVAQLNIWSSISIAVSINDVVIWNNNHYLNLTGAWGTAPSGDAVNWSLLPKTQTNGYILEVDLVKYNVITNTIVYRADKRNNEVDLYIHSSDNTLVNFQWGRDVVLFNKVTGESDCAFTNSWCAFIGNIVSNATLFDTTNIRFPEAGIVSYNIITTGSALNNITSRGNILRNHIHGGSQITVLTLLDVGSEINDNVLNQASTIQFTTLNGTGPACFIDKNTLYSGSQIMSSGTISGTNISENYLANESALQLTAATSGNVTNCEINNLQTVGLGNLTTTYARYRVESGFSNWPATLDYSNSGIFTGTTLTIPSSLAYAGVFTAINCTSTTTTKIVNSPVHPYILKPANGQTLQITQTTVGSAVANSIIGSTITVPATTLATGRTNGGDEFCFKTYGSFVGNYLTNIWA